MRTARVVLALILVVLVCSPVFAKGKGKKGGHKAKDPAATEVQRILKGISLTGDQQAKVDGIVKDFGPKLTDAQGKLDNILTPEQKQAKKGAQKAAKASGQKGKAAKQAIADAVKLTADQQAKMKDAQRNVTSLKKQLREAVVAVLTPEQKAQLTPAKGGGKKGGKGHKKVAK